MTNEITGAAVFSGGDRCVDDHHAGRGCHGNVHRRLADGVVCAVAGHEHAVQQWHDDETAADRMLPKSPVSLSWSDEVPRILTRKSRLQPAEFLITSAKRLLQHYRHLSDMAFALDDVR